MEAGLYRNQSLLNDTRFHTIPVKIIDPESGGCLLVMPRWLELQHIDIDEDLISVSDVLSILAQLAEVSP